MREWLIFVSEQTIIVIDTAALLVVIYATIEAFIKSVMVVFTDPPDHEKRAVWLRFSRWLVAALTFQLAADIVETSISMSWEALGRIAIVAIIRTMLNYFLERDVESISAEMRESAKP
jgi:uncharacterized membrane protein